MWFTLDLYIKIKLAFGYKCRAIDNLQMYTILLDGATYPLWWFVYEGSVEAGSLWV